MPIHKGGGTHKCFLQRLSQTVGFVQITRRLLGCWEDDRDIKIGLQATRPYSGAPVGETAFGAEFPAPPAAAGAT